MSLKKINIIALSCIALLAINACSPLSVQPDSNENLADSSDNILNLLDPDITTEEQAYAKGEAALNEGKSENALFYFIKTLQFNKNNVKALEHIAAIHNNNQHPELAVKIYQDILSVDNKNPLANENLGLYFLQSGQSGKAKDYLSAAVTSNSSSWKAHNGLGVIADLANNNAEAITHYQAALAIQPTNPMLLNNLGYSYYLTGDDIKAKYFFNQALSYDNQYDRTLHNLALIEIKNNNIPAATALFNRIMPVHESYNNIGYISMLLGQYDVAEEYLQRAIDESPVFFPKAQENLKTLSSLKSKPRVSKPLPSDLAVKPSVSAAPNISTVPSTKKEDFR